MATKNSNTAGTELGAHDVLDATDESSRLVHGFVPEEYDLGVLAQHYLEDIHATRCRTDEETGGSTGERVTAFALGRLAAIESILGRDELGRVLTAAREEGNEGPPLDEILDLVTENAGEGNGVNDESAHVVQAFVPTVQELAVLARHYLDLVNEIRLDYWETVQSGSPRFTRFLERQLGSIFDAIGFDAFEAAVESIAAKWRTINTEIKAKGIICAECGAGDVVGRGGGDCHLCGSPIDPETAGLGPSDLPGIWLTFR